MRGIVRGLVLLAVILAGIRFWALVYMDQSATARALLWFTPDAADWQKFPARPINASHRPLALPAPATPVPGLNAMAFQSVPMDGFLAAKDTTAFLVARGEKLLYEAYFNGAGRDTVQASFSLALPFASTLVGLAVADGFVDPDDPVALHLPEFAQQDARFADITLRHLLSMASGLGYNERGLPWSDDAQAYYSPDLRHTAMQVQYESPPGQQFHDNHFNPLILGMVLERATGMEVAGYLEKRLWQPMGAEGAASWSLDSDGSGFERMRSGLNARAVDFLKLGILFAQEGRINNKPVVSQAWVAEATRAETSLDPSLHYQFYWWVFPEKGTFAAIGDYGQFLYVDPTSDLVILRMGTSDGGLERMQWIAILDELAAALTKG